MPYPPKKQNRRESAGGSSKEKKTEGMFTDEYSDIPPKSQPPTDKQARLEAQAQRIIAESATLTIEEHRACLAANVELLRGPRRKRPAEVRR